MGELAGGDGGGGDGGLGGVSGGKLPHFSGHMTEQPDEPELVIVA